MQLTRCWRATQALAGALALPCFARHHAALLRTLLADCEARAGALLVTGSPLESPPPLAPLFTAAGLPAPPPPPTGLKADARG